tara:strand:- start:875 stop:1225 length:351 start_codon:yes stop_codon:yes gene_type:complete
MISFYQYNKCGTCRKAKKFLDGKKISYRDIDITRTPPPKTVLKKALAIYGIKKLFNTSGLEYREKKIKGRIATMTPTQALELLSSNGRLIKRPIIFEGEKITVGFNEDQFELTWAR